MTIPYLDNGSSNRSLAMNQRAGDREPVAWRSMEVLSNGQRGRWRVHIGDPTENLKRYAIGNYEVEPLFVR